ncbi:MAG: endonuclease/exonuclease/phosphatase family protein, partial [Lentisphaerae bacterium]|nr:endonuclease/exonuclease/phosphatase family protein [Lentisphaerota bacterium]
TGAGMRYHFPLHGYGFFRKTEKTLKAVTAFIASESPDIVGLVEVDGGSFRSHRKNQAQVIADKLGHFHTCELKYGLTSVARRIPIMNKQLNACIARQPIQNARFHYFDRGVKRLAIEMELKDLTVFLVHLSLGYLCRSRQLQDLFALVREVKRPCLVAGDFNFLRGDRELRHFLATSGLHNASRHPQPSYPSWAPKRQLDFIFHNRHVHVTHFRMPKVIYSDHLPLICDFELRT